MCTGHSLFYQPTGSNKLLREKKMTKEEVRFSVMCAISMALKSPRLQLGFENICENLSDLEKENAELQDKLKNLSSVAEVRLANWQKYEKQNAELKKGLSVVNASNSFNKDQLTKAKELIEDMYYQIPASHSDYYKDVMERAKKFLKEEN